MILIDTVALRWWALLVIPIYLFVATRERSLARALRFLLVAAVVSYFAEYSATRSGFPYGRLEYVADTSEWRISNVPMFVPLTFGVVVWAGRALAVAGLNAKPMAETIVGGALVAAALDLVIDPMTLRGGQWFLGELYRYETSEGYFNVPWSNTGGWILVSGFVIAIDEVLERRQRRLVHPIAGPALAFGGCLFFILVASFTRNFRIALASAIITWALWLVARHPLAALVQRAQGPEHAPGEAAPTAPPPPEDR